MEGNQNEICGSQRRQPLLYECSVHIGTSSDIWLLGLVV